MDWRSKILWEDAAGRGEVCDAMNTQGFWPSGDDGGIGLGMDLAIPTARRDFTRITGTIIGFS